MVRRANRDNGGIAKEGCDLKRTEFERLLRELRLGHLKSGYDLTMLLVDAKKAAYETAQFVEAITEGYMRICAHNTILREALERELAEKDGENTA